MDVPLSHLDRPFDYLLTEEQAALARPGVRVRVRFSGRLVGGFLTHREDRSEHDGRLAFVDRIVSAEPVLSDEILHLARAVTDRYAGTLADVLRLAVPPRHAKVEAEPERFLAPAPLAAKTDADGWQSYPAGAAFLRAVGEGRPVRAAWQALPGEDWVARLAELARAAATAGRGALLLVPDAADLRRLDQALTAELGPGRHIVLSADLGPAERYRRFLAVRRGHVKVVAGTRAAAFAPVPDLGLLAIFDDGYDVFAEPRAPYPHTREVLTLRSATSGHPAVDRRLRPFHRDSATGRERLGQGRHRGARGVAGPDASGPVRRR